MKRNDHSTQIIVTQLLFSWKDNLQIFTSLCIEIHWSVCKRHSLEVNVRGGGGIRNG